MLWDTSTFMEKLLSNFEELLWQAFHLKTNELDIEFAQKVAIVGFLQSALPGHWRLAHYKLIARELQNDLSEEALSWYEESTESILVFSYLIVGGLLGKYQSNEIDDAQFYLGMAHLAGFNSMNNQVIFEQYENWKKVSPTLNSSHLNANVRARQRRMKPAAQKRNLK